MKTASFPMLPAEPGKTCKSLARMPDLRRDADISCRREFEQYLKNIATRSISNDSFAEKRQSA